MDMPRPSAATAPPPPGRFHEGAAQPPTVTVVRQIMETGAPDSDAIVSRWSRLSRPLPLLGRHALTVDKSRPALITRLQEDCPWHEAAIEALWDEVALWRISGADFLKLSPMLLVGPPGCGKSHLARQIARAAFVPSGLLNVGGSADNRLLEGTARGYMQTQPCWPVMAMEQAGCANPVLIVDELDKAGGSSQSGRVHHTLLSMVEPSTASRYLDQCLLAQVDLSHVSWVMTANSLAGIPPPLLSRLRVIEVSPPSRDYFPALLDRLLASWAQTLGVHPGMLPALPEVARRRLEEVFACNGSVREVRQLLGRMLGRLARYETPQH